MRRSIGALDGQSDGQVMRNFLDQNGIELRPPSLFYYSNGKRTLLVYSTQENLAKLERLIGEIISGE